MLKIEKLIPGGTALATREDGKKIFLWNALPGEEIEDYTITKEKSTYAEGIATKIKTASTHRITPRDPHFLSTSPWQIMDYDYELEEKANLIAELFREHQIKIDKPPVLTDGHDFFYRNKMEYALYFDKDEQKIFPAFHSRGSHQKVKITHSSIEKPEIFAAATAIIDEMNQKHDEARRYQSLLLRSDQNGHVSGGLLENRKPHPSFATLKDSILGKTYSYSPNGFFQINLPVYELALTEIKKHLKGDYVLDLYSGVGTIGLSVADGKNLALVESNAAAFKELEKNAKEFPGAKPILAKSEDVLEYIEPDQTVILDPPRAGCDAKLIEKLLEIKPKQIIYLSCNPATQARDVKKLLAAYTISNVTAFNFFPRTPHIENLVVLSL